MRSAARMGVVIVGLFATGCPDGHKVQAPTQPKLEGVRLVGHRLCGTLAAGDGTTFSFDCPPLPTIEGSAWVLTPAWTPATSNPQRLHANRSAVITVSAPSLTEIDVELVRLANNPNLPLDQVNANLPGKPGEVGAAHEVGVVRSDDGTKKTWQIEVQVSACTDYRKLQIFNRSSSSPSRSNPLSVTLVRDPAEEICVGGGGPIYAYVGSSRGAGPGDPVNPRPNGPCPGGGQPRLFQLCENCATLHPPDLNFYSAAPYCDWNEVLAVYGYSGPAVTKPQVCTLREVASREACEGPP